MPRVAEARPGAEPVSAIQQERHRRILRVAAMLGAQHGLERVQMQEVAKEAGVAIATLYRYFPSKTHLFASVMAAQMERLGDELTRGIGQDPIDAVVSVLVSASRRLLATPLLAHAMIQSNNVAQWAVAGDSERNDAKFQALVLGILGVANPSEQDATVVRLVSFSWYGLLTQALNGRSTLPEVESDIEVACRLLLGSRFGGGGSPVRTAETGT